MTTDLNVKDAAIPEGVFLIDDKGTRIEDLNGYNNAIICIVTREMPTLFTTQKFCTSSDMPCHIPNHIGVYYLHRDSEGWLDWEDITVIIDLIDRMGLFNRNNKKEVE